MEQMMFFNVYFYTFVVTGGGREKKVRLDCKEISVFSGNFLGEMDGAIQKSLENFRELNPSIKYIEAEVVLRIKPTTNGLEIADA